VANPTFAYLYNRDSGYGGDNARRMYHPTCLGCGNVFDAPHHRTKYCSRLCYRRRARVCAGCGSTFNEKRAGKFCSYRCKGQAYRNANPGTSAVYVARSRAKNIERARANGRRSDLKRRGRKMAAAKQWRQANRTRHIANVVAWQKRNPDRVRVYDLNNAHKRRARKLGTRVDSERTSYRAFIRQVKTAATMPCYWCKKQTPKARRQIDHIVPLARDGPDTVLNLCMSCITCNSSRRAKLPEEFCGQFELPFVA